MTNTVIYDGESLPINISSEEVDLAANDWTAYLFRDGESFVEMPKALFSEKDGVWSYTIPSSDMQRLAKGMYSIRIDTPEGPVVYAYVISLKKRTILQEEE